MRKGRGQSNVIRKSFKPLIFVSIVSCTLILSSLMPGILHSQRTLAGPSSSSTFLAYDWAHDSIGATSPATTWYLPYGRTSGGTETRVVVQNPNATQVAASVSIMTDAGVLAPASLQGFPIPAQSNRDINLGDYVVADSFSTIVTSSGGGVVCERVTYGPGESWAHSSLGASSTATTWYLADGCTAGNIETLVFVQNPGTTNVQISVTLMTDTGPMTPPALQNLTVPAQSGLKIDLGDYTETYNVSTRITSTGGGVVCERVMYGPDRTWANSSLGATAPATSWYMPAGCTDGGRETWILIQNPTINDSHVNISLTTDSISLNPPELQGCVVPPGCRESFNLGAYVTDLTVSTLVTATEGEVVCEKAMYGDYRAWSHDSTGAVSTSANWYLPAGCTDKGRETWVVVQNPNPSQVSVNLKLQTDTGALNPSSLQGVQIPAETCQAFKLNDYVTGSSVSAKVEASGGVVCERTTYGTANSAFFFAEGYTGSGFDEWLCLMNPNTTATTAHITYMFPDGSIQLQDVPLGATTRATVNVNDVVGPDREVSIKVEANASIVAERPMYFNYAGVWDGGHDVVGAASPEKTFYFAEGYTGSGFDEYLCLMNPNTTAITAHITYMFSDGSTQGQDVTIGATARATVFVNNVVGPDKDVSVRILSDGPIVAERPMYFNYRTVLTGGHDVVGAVSPEKTFYFAEGYTGDIFIEYLCLMNPGKTPTTAHITYMFPDGSTQGQDVPLGATTRATVVVNDIVGSDQSVSAKVESAQPIVAERPMYFCYINLTYEYLELCTGGHDVMGASSPQTVFYFAEGYTGQGFEEWLCLMNPNTSSTTAHITYMFPDGTTRVQDVSVPSTSRATVNVKEKAGANRDVSIRITSSLPLVAERPMYFFYGGLWSGGHDVVGYTP